MGFWTLLEGLLLFANAMHPFLASRRLDVGGTPSCKRNSLKVQIIGLIHTWMPVHEIATYTSDYHRCSEISLWLRLKSDYSNFSSLGIIFRWFSSSSSRTALLMANSSPIQASWLFWNQFESTLIIYSCIYGLFSLFCLTIWSQWISCFSAVYIWNNSDKGMALFIRLVVNW